MKKSTIAVLAIAVLLSLQLFPMMVNASETAVYSEGFESTNGGFTHTGTLDQWQWGTPTNPNGPGGAHGGTKCWATNLVGNVPSSSDSYLKSPAITLPSITANQLMRVQFYAWIAVDEMYDRGEFQVSSDGSSWITKAQLFHRMQNIWSAYDFDVSSYAGGSIYLRFRLYADGSDAFSQSTFNMAGLYIDDIKITIFDTPATKTTLTLEAQEEQSAYASCPWVFSWDGASFVQDNDIYSTARYAGNEYADYYKLNAPLVAVNNQYLLDLREITQETSYTDVVKLMAVDHAASVKVAPDEDGNVWTYSNPVAPVSAVDNNGNNVLSQISSEDDVAVKGFNGDFVTLDFSNVNVNAGATLVLKAAGFRDDGDAGAPTGVNPVLLVQTKDVSGNWVNQHVFYPRNNFAVAAYDLTQCLSANKLVRLYVNSCHTKKYQVIDYIALDNNAQANTVVNALSPLSAVHSVNGDVSSKLAVADGQYASMSSQEIISLAFAVPTLGNGVRDFVLLTKGYYVPGGTYFIATWDGSSWVERDGWSVVGASDQVHTFDMSLFLPDPTGQYRVRIWQDFWYEPAAIDYVGLTHGGSAGTMTAAMDLRKNLDVLNLLKASDDSRDSWGTADSGYPTTRNRNRWVEVTFSVAGPQNIPPTTNPVVVAGLSGTPTISWTYNDQDGDPQVSYEVEVWAGSGGTGANMWDPPAGSGTGTLVSYRGSALTPGQTYYARVKAFDGKDWGQWSEKSFVVTPPVQNTPPTTNPVIVTNLGSSTPTISWTYADSDGDAQANYQVQVWSGPGRTGTSMWNPAAGTGIGTSVTYGGSALTIGQTYYACVKAYDGKDWGQWSETSFATAPQNVVPEVPLGTVAGLASMIMALVAFVGYRRTRLSKISK